MQGNYSTQWQWWDVHLSVKCCAAAFGWADVVILHLCFQVIACSHSQLVNKSLIASQHPRGDYTSLCQQESCLQWRSNTISPERTVYACSGHHYRHCHTTGFTYALFSLQDSGCCCKRWINRFSLPDRLHWALMCMKALAVHWMQGPSNYIQWTSLYWHWLKP